MTIRTNATFRALLVGLSFTLLGGCGVLTVDVDVYKGPLVNEEDVQTGEVTILAIAAKPLLIGLRDRLQFWPVHPMHSSGSSKPWTVPALDPSQDAEETFRKEIRKAREAKWYRDGFIPYPYWQLHLEREQARNVNAILGLYEDTTVQDFSGLVEQLERQLKMYKQARQDLEDREGAHKIYSRFREKLLWNPCGDLSDHPLRKHPPEGLTDHEMENWRYRVEGMLGGMISGFDHYFEKREYSGKHSSLPINLVGPFNEFAALTEKNQTLRARYGLWLAMTPQSANDQFAKLQDETTVRPIAALLFRPDALVEDRTLFVTNVRRIADAFIHARGHMADALELALNLIDLVNSDTGPRPPEFDRANATDALAHIVTHLVRPERLAKWATGKESRVPVTSWFPKEYAESYNYSLRVDARRQDAVETIKALATMKEADQLEDLANIEEYRIPDRREALARTGLHKLILEKPLPTAHALHEAHTSLRGNATRDPTNRFGLVRGPSASEEEQLFLEITGHNMGELFRATKASALESGRLTKGLNTLIEEYLQVADTRHGPGVINESKRRLFDALVRFAKTLVVMGDNMPILTQGDSQPQWDQSRSPKKYVRILQTVGNSILVHVNELLTRDNRKRDDFRLLAKELDALRRARSVPADAALKSLPQVLMKQADEQEQVGNRDEAQVLRETAKVVEENLTAVVGSVAAAPGGKASETVHAQLLKMLQEKLDPATSTRQKAETVESEIKKAVEYLSPATPEIDELVNMKGRRLTPMPTARELWLELKEHVGSLLVSEIEDPKNSKGSQSDRAKLLQAARDALTAVEADVVKIEGRSFRRETFTKIRESLVKKRDTDTTALKKAKDQETRLKNAVAHIQAKPIPTTPPEPNVDRLENPKEVLDSVISELKYEHLQAAKVDTGKAEQISKAINLAYEYRTGMVYIRPPSAYLRSSFPASSLQRDASLHWTNSVGHHGMRAIPGWGSIVYGKYPDSELQQELDKQSWQNINRVRVAGGGNVNYVVAKDDIGNWYVKNYSADPKSIINSAKKLALFGLGNAFKKNLLEEKKTDGTQDSKPAESKDAFQKQLDKYKKEYEDQAKKDNQDFREKAGGLKKEIVEAWKKDDALKDHAADLQKGMDAPHEEWAKEMEEVEKKTDLDNGEKSVESLRSTKRFYRAALSGVGGAALSAKPDAATEKTIRERSLATLKRLVQNPMERFIERRQEAVSRFETQAGVLGDAVGE